MSREFSRRQFLSSVSTGTLIATLGPHIASELGFFPKALGDGFEEKPLHFGNMESLVCQMQETPVEQLQSQLARMIATGTSLRTFIGAAALANARTFGGEDYVGFHTFMAMAPALEMSKRLPTHLAPLPVFKVLYRNTDRIQQFGGRDAEVLHQLDPPVVTVNGGNLQEAIVNGETSQSEHILRQLISDSPVDALNALVPLVLHNPEVHRTVLPFRAWDMQRIVGTEHAMTLLRQSLHYCLAQPQIYQREAWKKNGDLLTSLLDEFRLLQNPPGSRMADDAKLEELTEYFSTCQPDDAARAAAMTLSEGFHPSVIAEAVSLAATRLVLRDAGRLPQWESVGKPAGCVHGDSPGVHASDTANAWRHMAKVTTGASAMACVIFSAWEIARDRTASPNLLNSPLPTERHLAELTSADPDRLLIQLEESIRQNQQAHATAIAYQYGQKGLPVDRIFSTLLKFAVSEDGALHAEKYFQTVQDEFASTRAAYRWQHVAALARVTASEYGHPAPGQDEARQLLGVQD
ncbi:MAG: hypothetical protein R3C20_09460 [Planctomycetaceae bacterium]